MTRPEQNTRRYVRFLTLFLFTPVAAFFTVFWIAGTQWYLRHDGYPGLRNIGYSQRLHGVSCEILIYGDSSSLTGVNPQIVEQITHRKTCNVSEGSTIQDVVGSDLPLQAFLRHNPAPRLIIGMWNPIIFRPYNAPFTAYSPEGMLYALDYMSPVTLVKHFALHNRSWLGMFLSWSSTRLSDALTRQTPASSFAPFDARAQRQQLQGQWPYPLPPETHCVRPEQHYSPDVIFHGGAASAAEFRHNFTTPQSAVLIDVAPVADCDPWFGLYQHWTAGLHDNPLEALPIRDFNEGDVHFSPAGSAVVSRMIGEQALALLGEPANEPGGSRPSR